MTNYGDAKRAAAAHDDLSRLVGSDVRVGLVLLDDDHREQPVIEGQVIRVGADSLLFRRDGLDEDIPLALICKRVQGETVLVYGEMPRP
jgi:hypothetical protein